ncbi:MAG TPA: roadblock/LC7 domain-containing protein [Methylomirabilota bacterium]|nr:roadblock/LC7 domain-containing protein [Methylomirabilota bacterium]
MATLPQLIEEDIQTLNAVLRDFLAQTDATTALVIDKGGFLITHEGEANDFDLTTIGALASGAFMANQTIAGLVNEPNFSSIHQQGENFSLFVCNVDSESLLVVIFGCHVGVVKYFTAAAIKKIADQLEVARKRAPGQGVDLSQLNIANTKDVFRKREE